MTMKEVHENLKRRHCEEPSDEAIQNACDASGLLRFARKESHASLSRDMSCPSSALSVPPSGNEEGAGKTGYPLTPAVRVQQKSTRQNHRISQISGLPRAMVLTFIRALLGDRLDCPRRLT
jgi:hypothetical protein